MAKSNTPIQSEINNFIKSLNQAWLSGEYDKLKEFFHEEAVIVDSNFNQMASNREKCVKSYIDFCSAAKINSFKESKPKIDLFENTAIVEYSFEIDYEMNKTTYHETGKDVFILMKDKNVWLTIWRIMIPNQ